MSEAVGVRIEAVSKRFEHRVKGEVYAVKRVSLDVRPGELVTLLGPSGCGKTTTLRMIAGFEMPDEGRIAIGDREVTRVMANDRNVGFVFQSYALFPHLSVFENVAYGLRVQKKPEPEIGRAVGEVLELVGLAGYERQMPHQLSGGEQQRFALARAKDDRACCCSTNPCPISTPSFAFRCAARSSACKRPSASPRSTSRTTKKRPWRFRIGSR